MGSGPAGCGGNLDVGADALDAFRDDLFAFAEPGGDHCDGGRRLSKLNPALGYDVVGANNIDIIALLIRKDGRTRDREGDHGFHAFDKCCDKLPIDERPNRNITGHLSQWIWDRAADNNRIGVGGDRRIHIIELALLGIKGAIWKPNAQDDGIEASLGSIHSPELQQSR